MQAIYVQPVMAPSVMGGPKHRLDDQGISAHILRQGMYNAGFKETATGVAVASLKRKGLVAEGYGSHPDADETWKVFLPTESGLDWLLQNQDKLDLWNRRQTFPFDLASCVPRIPECRVVLQDENGTQFFFSHPDGGSSFRGRPRAPRVQSRPSRPAIRFCQAGEPHGTAPADRFARR